MSDQDNQQKTKVVATFSLLQLVIGIVAIIYGSHNLNDLCSDSFVHLAVWMVVQGSVFLFCACGLFICAAFLGDLGVVLYLAFLSLYGLFELIWTIMGAVILWRDSEECKNLTNGFYGAATATVIISLIFLCCLTIKFKVTTSSSNNS